MLDVVRLDFKCTIVITLRWRNNGRDSFSNHQPHHYLLNRLFRRWSKKTAKLHVTGLCVGNSPGTGEFLAQSSSNAENVSTWWRHHELLYYRNGSRNNNNEAPVEMIDIRTQGRCVLPLGLGIIQISHCRCSVSICLYEVSVRTAP